MHRQILIECTPCLLALAFSFLLLRILIRLSGAKWNWRRLREVHRCQTGGVQSLAFVLTLPLFIVIVQFIVQVSQLMIGVMVVNYAAHASARSACVWVAADVDVNRNRRELRENKLPPPIREDNPVVLTADSFQLDESYKYEQIYKAAALGCAPISPSRDFGFRPVPQNREVIAGTQQFYQTLVPSSRENARIPERLEHKIAYAYENTAVRVEFVDKNTRTGRTYNPRRVIVRTLPDGSIVVEDLWDPHEVGWQDPITVTVTHEFALLPGPGRFLSKFLVRSDGRPDRVSHRIDSLRAPGGERLYTTSIVASATMTNEGLKSTQPYIQLPE